MIILKICYEDEDKEITKEAEDKLDAIDEYLGDLNDELEEADTDSDVEELENRIEELEEQKEDISGDDDNWEYTEEAKQDYVESRMDDVRNDPAQYLRDWGLEDRMADFIDEDDFIEEVISTDGRGHTLSSYDGEEGEVVFNDEWYYVYRTN